MSRISTAFVVLLAALVVATLAAATAPGAGQPVYLNPHASIPARVNDLLHRMTLEEKVGQMDQIVIGKLRDTTPPANGDCNNAGGNNDPLQTTCLQRTLIDYKTGSILSGGTDNPADNTGRGWAEQYNTIQHYAVEHSRLHIPVIYGVDAVHGFGHPYRGARSSRSRSGWAPPGTPTSPRQPAPRRSSSCSRPAATGTSPRCRTSPATTAGAATTRRGPRSPRSRRRSARANIKGMQGGGFDSPQVAATVKHFAGYSQSINGHDRVEAQLPIRYLQDIFLPVVRGRDRRRRGDRDGRLRLDQQHPGDRVALPAHRGAAAPAGLQGRRDQRLRRRAGAADGLPHRGRLPGRDRAGRQRRRRREHDPVRLRRLEQRPDPGRPARARLRAADRPVGASGS